MNITPYLIFAALICVIALIITIMVGINPHDESYQKKTRNRITLLTSFYIIAFIPALLFAIFYFALR